MMNLELYLKVVNTKNPSISKKDSCCEKEYNNYERKWTTYVEREKVNFIFSEIANQQKASLDTFLFLIISSSRRSIHFIGPYPSSSSNQ
jgi:hypothetical protein